MHIVLYICLGNVTFERKIHVVSSIQHKIPSSTKGIQVLPIKICSLPLRLDVGTHEGHLVIEMLGC